MDIEAYRARAQAFATALNRAHHRRFAGLDRTWDPGSVHAAYADLFSERTIDALREGGARTRRLLRFAVEGRLGAATADADALRARAEADEGLGEIAAALVGAADPAARAELEERRLDVVTRGLTGPAAEALERVRAEARSLGWASARAMLGELRDVDLGALAAEAEALLRATAPPELGPEVVARHDLPRWHRAAWADGLLGGHALAALTATLASLGVQQRFAIDTTARAGKSARAFCAAIHVPDEVHLVVAPSGGLPEREALFHEAGHAVQLTYRDPSAPFEDRHLVDRADAEAVAFAFEALAAGPDADGALAAHREAASQLRARHLAAALLHDLDLLDEGAHPALRERYARRMAHATGLAWPSAPWLATADPVLSRADYLRALGRARRWREEDLLKALTG